MHRSILTAAAVGLAALAASGPAVALGGEAMEVQAARMNALAGGPISARDAELLERYGCESGTRSAFCQALITRGATIARVGVHISTSPSLDPKLPSVRYQTFRSVSSHEQPSFLKNGPRLGDWRHCLQPRAVQRRV